MADKNFIVKNGLTVGGVDIVNSSGVLTQSLITAVPSGAAATTQAVGNSSTALATTAYVRGEIDALIDSAPGTLNTLDELAAAINDDAAFNTTLTNAVALKAPLASPTFSGTVTSGGAVQINSTLGITGALTTGGAITSNGGNFIFNEDSGDYDFRVESNNNANMLFVDGGNDRVGIGTNAPTHMLHIVDGNNYAVLGDTQGNSTMSLRMADTSTFPIEVQAYSSELRFNTATTSGATPSVKMTILPSGNVGIGTTAPEDTLEVAGSLKIKASSSSAEATYLKFGRQDQSDGNYEHHIKATHGSGTTQNKITFALGNQSATGHNNVLIMDGYANTSTFGGTVVAGALTTGALTATGVSSLTGRVQPGEHIIFQASTGYLQMPTNSGAQAWAIGGSGGGVNPGVDRGDLGIHYWSGSAWTNPFMIDGATGNVGIGTASPSSKLHVNLDGASLGITPDGETVAVFSATSAASDQAIVSIISGTSGSSYLGFGDTASELIGRIRYRHTDNSMQFYVNGGERMLINSSGNISIGGAATPSGMASSGYKQIRLGSGTLADSGDSSGGNTYLGNNIYSGASNDNKFRFGAAASVIGLTGGDISFSTHDGGGASADATASLTRRMHIDKTGYIGIGTSDPETLLHIRGLSGNATKIKLINPGSNTSDDVAITWVNPQGDWSLGIDQSSGGKFKLSRHETLGNHDYASWYLSPGASVPLMEMYNAHPWIDLIAPDGAYWKSGITMRGGSSSTQAQAHFHMARHADYKKLSTAGDYDAYISTTTSGSTYGNLVFGTRDTEAMRIRCDDQTVCIGNTASIGSGPTSYLVVGDGSGQSAISIYTGSSSYGYLNFADGVSGAGADPGYIRYNHNDDTFYANRSFTAPNISDQARKENITDITDGWNIIKDLRPRKFDWKKDELLDDYLFGMGQGAAGFIAQEVETVLPNEVHGEEGGKGLTQIGIVAYLVKTVQELEARIKTLEG